MSEDHAGETHLGKPENPRKHRTIALIVASSLIIQQIDSTAVATALPSIASSFGVSSLSLHSTITTYLLALGIFLPVSGWLADKWGARRVFCLAVGLFTIASLACASSVNLEMLILSRFVQGFGAAMMLPTARLILVRSVPRSEIVSALALMSMPAVIGPTVGPLVGGFITGISSWRWIFWINLPVGIVSIAMTLFLIERIPPEKNKSFDWRGFLLSGFGIGAIIFSLDSLVREANWTIFALALAGLISLGFYILHAGRRPNAILDLRLFRYPAFRTSVFGGTLFRIGFGAMPFMLPLLLQVVFGFTPLQSGAITFIGAIGSFGMRALTKFILNRFGFRSVLLWNGLISSLFMGLCATFTNNTPVYLMMLIIFLGGVFRALQFTSLNALTFADVTDKEMSHATTISQMALRISQGIGVALAASLLQFFSGGADNLTNDAFSASIVVIAFMSAAAYFSFSRLSKTVGDALVGREKR